MRLRLCSPSEKAPCPSVAQVGHLRAHACSDACRRCWTRSCSGPARLSKETRQHKAAVEVARKSESNDRAKAVDGRCEATLASHGPRTSEGAPPTAPRER